MCSSSKRIANWQAPNQAMCCAEHTRYGKVLNLSSCSMHNRNLHTVTPRPKTKRDFKLYCSLLALGIWPSPGILRQKLCDASLLVEQFGKTSGVKVMKVIMNINASPCITTETSSPATVPVLVHPLLTDKFFEKWKDAPGSMPTRIDLYARYLIRPHSGQVSSLKRTK